MYSTADFDNIPSYTFLCKNTPRFQWAIQKACKNIVFVMLKVTSMQEPVRIWKLCQSPFSLYPTSSSNELLHRSSFKIPCFEFLKALWNEIREERGSTSIDILTFLLHLPEIYFISAYGSLQKISQILMDLSKNIQKLMIQQLPIHMVYAYTIWT